MKHTARFFKQTDRLLGRYELLKSMLSVFDAKAADEGEVATSHKSEPTRKAPCRNRPWKFGPIGQ